MPKRHDLPIVSLYAVRAEEERGSFLMDHVPTVVCPPDDERAAIERALNRLVDEALPKRALWTMQASYLEADGFDWRPVHAPRAGHSHSLADIPCGREGTPVRHHAPGSAAPDPRSEK